MMKEIQEIKYLHALTIDSESSPKDEQIKYPMSFYQMSYHRIYKKNSQNFAKTNSN